MAARSFASCSMAGRATSNDTAPAAPDGCFVFRLNSTLCNTRELRTDQNKA